MKKERHPICIGWRSLHVTGACEMFYCARFNSAVCHRFTAEQTDLRTFCSRRKLTAAIKNTVAKLEMHVWLLYEVALLRTALHY